MGKILEAFANDNLTCFDRFAPPDKEYKAARELVYSTEQRLLDLLDEERREALEQYARAIDDVWAMECTARFVRGYCLGALITDEVAEARERLLG